MAGKISIDAISKAVLKGIERAQKDYSIWSGGYWLWKAPEYLLVTHIAQEIARTFGNSGSWYLTLEHGAKQALKEAGATGKGKLHKKIRANGRFDLLFWWGGDKPRAPIEVKRQVSQFKQIKADVDRIEKVIHRKKESSRFQFGMVTFFMSSKAKSNDMAKENLEARLKAIRGGLKDHLAENTKFKIRKTRMRTGEDSAWMAVAIVISPK